MKIPVREQKPSLELKSLKFYSEGIQKVYTKHFYKSLNKQFGIEFLIKNNTSEIQSLKIGGCILASDGVVVAKWIDNEKINSNSTGRYSYHADEKLFNKLKTGKYSVRCWINDRLVKESSFIITYK
ncbi:MAG: hypothetical protein MR549_04255 [Lachnobacterium sp.]|nr:hypothetical protein [Lachnobacterium sp.]